MTLLTNSKQNIIYELNLLEDNIKINTSIQSTLQTAELEMLSINETIESLKNLKVECDKLDYALAVSSGILCGILDIFLVGEPNKSPLGDITDSWFENRIKDFAKLFGWKSNNDSSSAIRYLERKFKIPYDQRGCGDAGKEIFNLTPGNHHFKSLAHNPTLLGLFFSILDQFYKQSHFVSDGKIISLEKADNKFELRGSNNISKLFCAFVNWFGHLISDMSGAANSKGRGMGIPSPLLSWVNDIIVISKKLNLPIEKFSNILNDFAIEMFENGYDIRFQTAQFIPVFINGILVNLIYSTRRLITYLINTNSKDYSFKELWTKCNPFNNQTVKRMQMVAQGTFLAIDVGDAFIQSFIANGNKFNPKKLLMKINIVGVGSFAISLYGEIKHNIKQQNIKNEILFNENKKLIIENYIENLKLLSTLYENKTNNNIILDIQNHSYINAFNSSINLVEKNNSSQNNIVKNKSEIDTYFGGNKNND